jgi:DNA-binding MarR family transcriptional regulator
MATAKQLKYQLNNALEEVGVTASQWAVLAQIVTADNPLMAVEIASVLGMDKPTTSGIIQRLQSKAFIIKKPAPLDGRATILLPTEQGRAIFRQCTTVANREMAKFTAALDAQQKQTLTQLLTIIEREQSHG